jgi:hypothetical protein
MEPDFDLNITEADLKRMEAMVKTEKRQDANIQEIELGDEELELPELN